MPKNKAATKVIVPIIIIAIIVGIWISKNVKTDQDIQQDIPEVKDKGTVDNEVSTEGNPDFDLVTTKIDLEKLKTYGLPIIIDFGADACAPCKQMEPVLIKLNKELRGKVIIKFVDVWKHQNAAADFPVEVVPTQFFFDREGKPYVPADPEKMQMNMYNTKGTQEHIYTAHQGGMTEEQIMEVLREMDGN